MAGQGFTIDRARVDDIPALEALLAELFAIEVDFQPDADRQRRGLALLLEDVDRAVIMTARDPSAVVIGMASAQLVVSTAEGGPSAWIEDVLVAEPWRTQGIGASLLSALLGWARGKGATRAQLLADHTNLPALHFYRRLGWHPTQLNAWRLSL